MSHEFEKLLSDIDSLLHIAAELSGEELKEVTHKLQSRVTEAKESVVDIKDGLERKTRKSAAKLNREVHDEPWRAIGVGAALGLLIGLVVARR